jgi:hypothetical protein
VRATIRISLFKTRQAQYSREEGKIDLRRLDKNLTNCARKGRPRPETAVVVRFPKVRIQGHAVINERPLTLLLFHLRQGSIASAMFYARGPRSDAPKGGRGIRTPGTLPGTVGFKTTAIDHSAIPPGEMKRNDVAEERAWALGSSLNGRQFFERADRDSERREAEDAEISSSVQLSVLRVSRPCYVILKSRQWLKCTIVSPHPTPCTQRFCVPGISGAMSVADTIIWAVNDSSFASPAR